MNESSNPPEPTEATPTDPLKQPRRFRWEKNYVTHSARHWALNDTHSDVGHRVTCQQMTLIDSWTPNLQNEFFPKLIVELLNKHFQEEFDKANAPAADDDESLAGSQNWLRLERMILKHGSMIAYALENKSGFKVRFDGANAVQGDTLKLALIKTIDAHFNELKAKRAELQAKIDEIDKTLNE